MQQLACSVVLVMLSLLLVEAAAVRQKLVLDVNPFAA